MQLVKLMGIKFNRQRAFASKDTFSIKPIRQVVKTYLSKSKVSIDVFARNNLWATYTNDLNPETQAEYHLQAVDFLQMLVDKEVKADLILFDPPFSPRQVKECYNSIGLKMKQEDAWLTNGWTKERRLIKRLIKDNGFVITCGWNSNGMGESFGFKIIELLIVAHGWGHNDTIVTIEQKDSSQPELF